MMKCTRMMVVCLGVCLLANAATVQGLCAESPIGELKQKRAERAKDTYERWAAEFFANREDGLGVYLWSHRWAQADLSRVPSEASASKICQAHFERMSDVRRHYRERLVRETARETVYFTGDFYRADARIALTKDKNKRENAEIKEALTTRVAAAFCLYTAWSHLPPRRLEPHWAFLWSRNLLDSSLDLESEDWPREVALQRYSERSEKIKELAETIEVDDLREEHRLTGLFFVTDAKCLILEQERESKKVTELTDCHEKRLKFAKAAYEVLWTRFAKGRMEVDWLYIYSCHLRDAALVLGKKKSERTDLRRAHLSRMKKLYLLVEERMPKETGVQIVVDPAKMPFPTRALSGAEYYVADAEIGIMEEEGK